MFSNSAGWYSREVVPLLKDYLMNARWFGSKARIGGNLELIDFGVVRGKEDILFPLVRIHFASGRSELYLMPQLKRNRKSGGISSVELRSDDSEVFIEDAVPSAAFAEVICRLIGESLSCSLDHGTITGHPVPGQTWPEKLMGAEIKLLNAEQSNSSIVIGDRLIYKNFRKISEGRNPDFHIPLFLQEKTGFHWIPEIYGSLTYISGQSEYLIGTLSRFLPDAKNGWDHFSDVLRTWVPILYSNYRETGKVDRTGLPFTETKLLAETTSSLHNSLSTDTGDPEFSPEAISANDIEEWIQEYGGLVSELTESLEVFGKEQNSELEGHIRKIVQGRETLTCLGHNLRSIRIDGIFRTRVHGDYHLGQTLRNSQGFYVIDFEGEPMRTLEYRQRKLSPLKDVAGMLRSLDYAFGMLDVLIDGKEDLQEFIDLLSRAIREEFLESYYHSYRPDRPYLPENRDQRRLLLDFFETEKALYEVNYEVNNRPDFAPIPMRAVIRKLEAVHS